MQTEDRMEGSAALPAAAGGCVCPGSYDPLTVGHLDVIRRALRLFDRVYVGILDNSGKCCMFSGEEREHMARAATEDLPCVEVIRWPGLLVDLLDRLQIDVIVRGVRGNGDLAAEEQIAAVNRQLRPGTETVLLTADSRWRAVSSTIVRELISFGADISAFVPASVLQIIAAARS